ncbi:PolC-type DNA polymerase III [Shewanella intestini]|uniref:DNA-directed DNA polymerase n=1 Tax=Shewanella intestini TaxID=2017544 RepID=A0ABS5I4B6_9GAMM|nr:MULTISPECIES: 3'-5' exonuclease [Shewanella]MBR9728867.1 3'-5' exonuclease [Shewanella intestini]MRG37067.1 3'-5' exonuclease [Shewanella sp. XMDDZSB0408]
MCLANSVVVLDFETTGLSPDNGDRAIEIGAVKIVDGEIVDSFQELMNPGRRVNSFIEQYTGISNKMLLDAPSCEAVMTRFASFIGEFNLVAHNASFDKKFLDAEFERIGHQYRGQFACSLLLSRRIHQDAPNHKLGTLVEYHQLPNDGVFHRALADATMTGYLWLQQLETIKQHQPQQAVTFDKIKKITSMTKAKVMDYIKLIQK